jgi:predicted Fe-Mo cluster-binding NifX family protein
MKGSCGPFMPRKAGLDKATIYSDYSIEKEKEPTMKKIAVTSEGPGLDEAVDPRFGRAAGFVVIDPDTLENEYIDNGASQALALGAGIQAAETVVGASAGVLLTGIVGPKAFQALSAAGVKIVQHLENMTVREALERYLSGKAPASNRPDGPGRQG